MRTPGHYGVPYPLVALLRMDKIPVYDPYGPH